MTKPNIQQIREQLGRKTKENRRKYLHHGGREDGNHRHTKTDSTDSMANTPKEKTNLQNGGNNRRRKLIQLSLHPMFVFTGAPKHMGEKELLTALKEENEEFEERFGNRITEELKVR